MVAEIAVLTLVTLSKLHWLFGVMHCSCEVRLDMDALLVITRGYFSMGTDFPLRTNTDFRLLTRVPHFSASYERQYAWFAYGEFSEPCGDNDQDTNGTENAIPRQVSLTA